MEIIEPFGHLSRKVFQTADHDGGVALGLSRLASSLMSLMQLRQALSQAHMRGSKLCFVDDALGIAIDEQDQSLVASWLSADRGNDLVQHGGAVARWVMRRRYSSVTRRGSSKGART